MDNIASDPKTIAIFAKLFPPFLQRVLRVYARMEAEVGWPLRATEGCRSFARSDALVAAKEVVAAPAGLCFHNYGIAIDSCFLGEDPYLSSMKKTDPKKWGSIWNSFGGLCVQERLIWGGNWKHRTDFPHCELPLGGVSIHEIFALYKTGKMLAVWGKLDTMLQVTPTWPTSGVFNPEL